MESIDWKRLVLIAGIALVSACNSTTPSQTTSNSAERSTALFQLQPKLDKPALQTLQAHQGVHPYLTTLFNDPATIAVYPVNVNPNLITTDTEAFSVPLPDGKLVNFQKKGANPTYGDMVSWHGDVASDRKQRYPSTAEVDFDPFNWASIVRNGDQLVGSIHVDGQPYRLESIGASQHVLVKIDESKLPPEGQPEFALGENKDSSAIHKNPKTKKSYITLMFVTTNQSRSKYPNITQTLTQALAETNIYYNNSATNIAFVLTRIYNASYSETGKTYDELLDDVRTEGHELWKSVAPIREISKTDLVAMFVDNQSFCGLARVTATKEFAYSVFSCTNALAHEIGHNMGAKHKPSEGGNIPTYAYGYESTSPKFHTRMVTSHGAIPYFSNPRLRYQNAPLGTEAHNDAARRFDERREEVENFYPTPELRLTLKDDKNTCGAIFTSYESWIPVDYQRECRDRDVVPTAATIDNWSGTRTLCFANLILTRKVCYSGYHNGTPFTISNLYSGAGTLPSSIEFTSVGIGNLMLTRYSHK